MSHYDPYNFTPQKSLGYLLKVNHTLMHECSDKVLAQHDMSFIQWVTLLKLKEGLAETASELCRQMSHDNGAITRMLDQLETQGFIVRRRSQEDRRIVYLDITDAGKEKLSELTPLVIKNFNAALAPFSAEEFSELIRLLEKLKDRLQHYSAENQNPATEK